MADSTIVPPDRRVKHITMERAASMNKEAAMVLDTDANTFALRILKAAKSEFINNFTTHSFTDEAGKMTKWKPLAEFTRKRRIEVYHTNPDDILVDTGTLKNSFITNKETHTLYTDPVVFRSRPRENDSRAVKYRISHRKRPIREGTNFCYAGIHNNPDESKHYKFSRKKLIKRQFMGHTAAVENLLPTLEKTILMKRMP